MNSDVENAIIGSVYDAGLDASLWPGVIGQIVEYTHSKTAILTALDQLNPNSNFVHTWNIPHAGIDDYQNEHGKLIDMRQYMPLWKQMGIGDVIHQNFPRYAELPDQDEGSFYEKCLKATGICYIAGVLLDQGEYRSAVLGVHRSANEPVFQQEELDFLKRIGVHIRRALQIHKQLSFARIENRNLYKMLDTIKVGIILIDEYSRFYYSNNRAQQLMEQNKIFEFDQHNKICVAKPYQKKFEQLVQAAQADHKRKNRDIGGVLALENAEGQQFMVTATPFSSMNSLASLADQELNYVVLSISDMEQRYALAVPFLKEAYALSARECEICELFVNGLNLEKIAENCSLTMNSVRTYVKNIYAKMHCCSQTELLHKLMGMTIHFEHVY